jgi:hypothetical protein
MKTLIFALLLCLGFMLGCGVPRELPKTPAALNFPPPIYTNNFPEPEIFLGADLTKLRELRPTIEKVYHFEANFDEYQEVLTAHPYFSTVKYFIDAESLKIVKIEYEENSEVYYNPSYRLALLDELTKKFNRPLSDGTGSIYIFKTDKLILRLNNSSLEVLKNQVTEP